MLNKKQIKEIREHLEKAHNPIFFFDNDVDGLCSFLLLQRYLGKGKGIAVKSYPELDEGYFRRVQELEADYIFILDKPIVSKEFFQEIEKNNLPCVWIDHHEAEQKIPKFVSYYNPLRNRKKDNEPTTFLCYQITNKKEDLWLALVGCIADKYLPKFYEKFKKKYPDLVEKGDEAFEVLYKSQIGKVARIFEFALKDRTTNVISMLKFLMKAKSPYEILEETSKNKSMHYRFNQVDSRYQKFLSRAKEIGKDCGEILFFKYSGDLSISSDLSNELSYLFPKKIIVVAYSKGSKLNISIRGKEIKETVLRTIEKFENAHGGGHDNAVGVQINYEDFEKFKEIFKKNLKKKDIKISKN
jgi:single-stranded DNA-specific DHH superfamily exonuclease